jgi:hypothetical protein
MTPEELKTKIDELRTLIAEKLARSSKKIRSGGARRNARNWRTRSRSSQTTPW